MATSPRLSIDNELSPQEASVATLCKVLHRQWPDLFTITSTPRKFVECLYCAVSPPPILHVLSRSIESPVTYSLYDRSSHIHTFMHSCIRTLILSCIHTFIRTQRTCIYNINSQWLHQSPRVCFGSIPSVWSSIVSSGKFQQTNSLNPFKSVIPSGSGREMSLTNHFKWQVLTNE